MDATLAVLIGIYMFAFLPLWLGPLSFLTECVRKGFRSLIAKPVPVEAPLLAVPAKALVGARA